MPSSRRSRRSYSLILFNFDAVRMFTVCKIGVCLDLCSHILSYLQLLEETSAEDARVENEVMLLRKKIYGLNRTHSTPSLVSR